MKNKIKNSIEKSIEIKQRMLADSKFIRVANEVADVITESYKKGGKVLWCGNGGSAADAQHLAAELSGKFYIKRAPLFSEALHVNTSYLTAVANDFSYDVIFSRLVAAMGRAGDVLVGISTSGNSTNVVLALKEARKKGLATVGFTGEKKCKMGPLCDYLIKIPSSDTPRIQECQTLIGHSICEIVEDNLFGRDLV